MSTAFENQDMMIELLQQEGMLDAKGVTGNSATRQLQSAMAAFGRNQEVLAETLMSARRQTRRSIDQISLDKYSADISADANRMLFPNRQPDAPAPYKTPRATFQDPMAPVRGPAPIKGVNTAPQSSGLGIVAGALSGIASGVSTGISIYKSLR